MIDLDKCKNVAIMLFNVLPIKTHPVYSFLLDSHVFIKEKFYPYNGNIVDMIIYWHISTKGMSMNLWLM